MKIILLIFTLSFTYQHCYCWGFYAHRRINYLAVWLLPPEMLILYKPAAAYLGEHSIDPDKRRYVVEVEGPRHYIDLDRYGLYPYDSLPRSWDAAVIKYSEDSLNDRGIVPWWIVVVQARLTDAFKKGERQKILKLSAELGHYIADAHVPLHASSNHNGQHTGQRGIHGFWESRIPELLAEKEWDFFIGRAVYITDPAAFAWERVLESAAAADTVLVLERELTKKFPPDLKFSFEERNGVVVRQYSSRFTTAYDRLQNGMVERRMRQSIFAVASFWYTAWVNAGQPDLSSMSEKVMTHNELALFDSLNRAWKGGIKAREHEQ